MCFTEDEYNKGIKHLVDNQKYEDAILVIMHRDKEDSGHDRMMKDDILTELNKYLKRPFTREDLEISMNILRKREMIE